MAEVPTYSLHFSKDFHTVVAEIALAKGITIEEVLRSAIEASKSDQAFRELTTRQRNITDPECEIGIHSGADYSDD
jgi:hypothetical protein